MEQHLKTCFYFKGNVYALKITLGDIDLFFLVYGILLLHLISEDGIKKLPA